MKQQGALHKRIKSWYWGNIAAFFVIVTGLLSIGPDALVAEGPPPQVPPLLSVGGDYNFPPYEYLDENGTPTGFNTELTRAIADVMGMDVEIRLGPWADVRQSLEGGEIDALQGMFYSPARDAQVDFSTPHTIVYHAIFVRKEETTIQSLEDLKGKTIIVQRGDIMHDYAVEQQLTENLVAVETPVEALQLLNSTHYDAALLAKVQGLYLASEYAFSNITTVGTPFYPTQYCFAVREGNAQTLALLNEGLRIIKETGRYQEIYNTWLGVVEPQGIAPKTLTNYALLVLLPLTLLLIGLSLWSWSLKQKLAELTRSMTAESAEGLRALAALQRRRLWLPTASMFVLLCLIVWIAEIWELPRVFYGGVDTAINWQEALFETAIIALVGILTISNLIRDINERREIEIALQESERKYRSYIDDAPDGIFVVDAAGHYLEVNPKACAMAGYTEAELLTMSLTDLLWPDMLEAGRQHFARANETGKVGGEFPIRTKDNRKRYMLVEIVALSKDRYLGFSKDITERREADIKLHQQTLQLAMLNDMGSKIAAVLDLDHLLQRAAALIQTSFDYPYVAIVELDPQHGEWVLKARYEEGEKLPSIEHRVTLEQGLVGWAATHNEIVLINDVTADPRYITLYDKDVPTLSELCVPLCAGKKVVGVLDIQSPEQDAFHENDLLVMQTLADQIAVAMQNAGLYKKLQQELVERQQAQAALQENERALQKYTERLRILHAIDGAILAAASPQEIANAALRHIQTLVPCWGTSIVTLDSETGKAIVFAANIGGEAQPVSHQTFLLQAFPDTETLKSGRVVIQNDISTADVSSQIAAHLKTIDIRAYLIAPLIAHGSLVGLLILGAKTPGTFTADHIDIVHEIANQVAVVFRQAQLHLELEIERQRLKTLMDHLPQGILLLDAEKRILLANPAASACLPYLSQNGSGGPLTSLAGHPIEGLVMAPGEKSYYELTIPSAPCKIVEAAAQPIGAENKPEGWTLVIQDVTEEREVQRRVQQQERLASVGQMAGGIAHDFNNFLTTIMLYAQLPLRKAALPPDLTKAFETILGESRKAAELVQQILDFSRRSPIAMAPMDLKPFVKEAVKLLSRTLPENIEVTVEAEVENCIINGDPTRIQQIIMNLTLNARDAMPDGGEIRIALSHATGPQEAELLITQIPVGAWICMAVADTGSGLTPEALDHLFEPFFTTKPAGKGTGLGLAQVYGIVKQHEGHIGVQTTAGKGTTFRIYFPAYTEQAEAPLKQEVADLAQGQGETILLVEDKPELLALSQEILESLGYRVLAAPDGVEALSRYEAEGPIDLLITDLVMPKMGGKELIQTLRKSTPGLKVIAMTGYEMEESVETLRAGGILKLIHKPFDEGVLARTIREILDK